MMRLELSKRGKRYAAEKRYLDHRKAKKYCPDAHDSQKPVIIQWCEEHKDILKEHFLHGTGTTARMITDRTGLPVRGYNSGPLGGDLQIGAKNCGGEN